MSITYLDTLSLKNGLSGVAKSFYKSIVYDQKFFESIEDEDLRQNIKEEYERELEEHLKNGKNLNKYQLTECLPTDPKVSFVSVSKKDATENDFWSVIAKIEDVQFVSSENSDVIRKIYSDREIELRDLSTENVHPFFAMKIWH